MDDTGSARLPARNEPTNVAKSAARGGSVLAVSAVAAIVVINGLMFAFAAAAMAAAYASLPKKPSANWTASTSTGSTTGR
jgi:hypothetical protein